MVKKYMSIAVNFLFFLAVMHAVTPSLAQRKPEPNQPNLDVNEREVTKPKVIQPNSWEKLIELRPTKYNPQTVFPENLRAIKLVQEKKDQSESGVISAEGELEPVRSRYIRNKTKSNLTIIELVPEGTIVKKGDELVRFDASQLEVELQGAQIELANAEATVRAASQKLDEHKSFFTVSKRMLESKSELLKMESEFLFSKNGKFATEEAELERTILLEDKRLKLLKEILKSERYAKEEESGEVLELQVKIQESENMVASAKQNLVHRKEQLIPLQRKRFALEKEELEFQEFQQSNQLESQIAAAASIVAKSKLELQQRKEVVTDLESQIQQCVIKSPVAGKVYYPHDYRRQLEDEITEEGAIIRAEQTVLFIPDPRQLQATVTISESLIDQVEVDQLARVYSETSRLEKKDSVAEGVVSGVRTFPVGSWERDKEQRYKYKVIIKLNKTPKNFQIGDKIIAEIKVD